MQNVNINAAKTIEHLPVETIGKKTVSKIRKCHNHILQTNSRHCEEETQNNNSYKTPGRQLKSSHQLSLPRQDDFKTRKECTTKQGPNIEPHKQMGGTLNNCSMADIFSLILADVMFKSDTLE